MSSEFVAVAGCWEHVNGYFAAGCHCEEFDDPFDKLRAGCGNRRPTALTSHSARTVRAEFV